MMNPDMKREFTGIDGTVGFIAWNGNKQAGEGEQEIKAIDEGKSIEMEIRFVRPMAEIAHAKMTTESLTDNQTKVIWTTAKRYLKSKVGSSDKPFFLCNDRIALRKNYVISD